MFIEIYRRTKKTGMDAKENVRLRLVDGRDFTLYHKVGVKALSSDLAKFNKDGSLRKKVTLFNKDLHDTIIEHINAVEHVYTFCKNNGVILDADTFETEVDKFLHPEKYKSTDTQDDSKSFYELAEEYLNKKQFSYDHTKGFRVLIRAIARYEGFIRATDNKNFSFDVNTVSRDTIEDFTDYLRNEKDLSEEYPKIFAKLMVNYPANVKAGYHTIEGRGENATIKLIKKLKAFFHWLVETDRITNRPFEGVKVGSEKYGTPFYLTIEERNNIASTPMPAKHLEVQRDIFVFHCFVGCRVSDLMRLTYDNIQDGVLSYAPHKTKDEGEQSRLARIPLHPKALALIEKYKDMDKKGRLFPYISPQKYNDAIKAIFKVADITRNVTVRNALTGENEIRPINEVASSHIARRTFVGNAYKQVSDPNIIGAMSGHVEGSKAFARYRNIEDETLKNVINLIG